MYITDGEFDLLQLTTCLLENGATVNAGDAVKFSPLHIACNFGHDKVCKA